jgi:hypothetical protein
MIEVQGTNKWTRLEHLLRQLRAAYVTNQREGKHPRDTGQLAKGDALLEKVHAYRLSAKR